MIDRNAPLASSREKEARPPTRRELAEGLMSGSKTARAQIQRSASASSGSATARAARRAALPF